jgi:hypothetical protein
VGSPILAVWFTVVAFIIEVALYFLHVPFVVVVSFGIGIAGADVLLVNSGWIGVILGVGLFFLAVFVGIWGFTWTGLATSLL